MTANLAALMPAPSKAASISCRLGTGVRTRPRLSCLRIFPAGNNDAVDDTASRLRPLHDLRQVGLAAEAERKLLRYSTGAASFAQRKPTWLLPVSGGVPRLAEGR